MMRRRPSDFSILVAWLLLLSAGCDKGPGSTSSPPRPDEGAPSAAQDVLKKIEETLEHARTVKVRGTTESFTPDGRAAMKIPWAVLLKEGNKVSIEMTLPASEFAPATEATSVCDGTRMKSTLGGQTLEERDALKGCREVLLVALARGDVVETDLVFGGRVAWPAFDFGTALEVSDVKAGPNDQGAKTLTYRLKRLKYPKDPGPEHYVDVKLWYDPAAHRPLKRSFTHPNGATSIETLEELLLDIDIADESFAIPPAKRQPSQTPPDVAIISILRGIGDAEEDFRHNDRDNNKINDYWVGDVSGLYRLLLDGQPISEIPISYSDADARPLKSPELAPLRVKEPVPVYGYLLVTVEKYKVKNESLAYDDGTHRNASHYGVAAYPADYPKTTLFTLIMNETRAIYRKDTGGKPPAVFPEDPAKDGWEQMSRSASPYMEDPLVSRLVRVSHSWERSPALEEMAQLPAERREQVRRLLIAATDDSEPYVRQNAIEALGFFEEAAQEAATAIRPHLQDSANHVRSQAMVSLARLGFDTPPGTISTLTGRLLKGKAAERLDAAIQLGNIALAKKGLDVRPALQPLLAALKSDPDSLVRTWAAAALGNLGLPEAIPGLTAALQDPDVPTRGYAEAALRQIRERESERR